MQEQQLVMLAERLQRIQTELPDVEVKAAKQGCPKIFDSLSSLANQSGGGIILFGLDERAGFEACGVYDAGDLMTQVTNQCLQMEPELRPLYTAAEYEGRIIVSAEIPEIEYERKPCYYKGKGRLAGSYIRVGDQDLHMTEYEVYSYEAYRKKTQDELRPCPRATMEDLDASAVNAFESVVKSKKPNLSRLGRDRALQMLGMTEGGSPTLAGLMLLGTYPQACFPQFCITAVVVPGSKLGEVSDVGERFTDNARIEGTLPQMLEQAMAFVARNIPVATVIDPVTGRRTDRPLYPVIAVREILLNALIHRDYSTHTESIPIVLRLFSDRLELENPGGLYGRMTLDLLGRATADTRNPFIAGAMELLSLTENRYSGIPTIQRVMRENGLRPAEFEIIRGSFRVTLYNRRSGENADAGDIQRQIVAFCSIPRTREELANRFSDMTISYFMGRYLKPLIQQGIIHLSIPDKPRSKYQKYYA